MRPGAVGSHEDQFHGSRGICPLPQTRCVITIPSSMPCRLVELSCVCVFGHFSFGAGSVLSASARMPLFVRPLTASTVPFTETRVCVGSEACGGVLGSRPTASRDIGQCAWTTQVIRSCSLHDLVVMIYCLSEGGQLFYMCQILKVGMYCFNEVAVNKFTVDSSVLR